MSKLEDLQPGPRLAGVIPGQNVSVIVGSRTGTYQWALVPSGQPIEIGATKVEGQATSLAERAAASCRRTRCRSR